MSANRVDLGAVKAAKDALEAKQRAPNTQASPSTSQETYTSGGDLNPRNAEVEVLDQTQLAKEWAKRKGATYWVSLIRHKISRMQQVHRCWNYPGAGHSGEAWSGCVAYDVQYVIDTYQGVVEGLVRDKEYLILARDSSPTSPAKAMVFDLNKLKTTPSPATAPPTIDLEAIDDTKPEPEPNMERRAEGNWQW